MNIFLRQKKTWVKNISLLYMSTKLYYTLKKCDIKSNKQQQNKYNSSFTGVLFMLSNVSGNIEFSTYFLKMSY